MTAYENKPTDPRKWRTATALVHGGTVRSQFGETSEALFLNAGFVYNSAEDAEARFKGEQEGFVYSRFSNPTVAMFEQRMALLEGADAARATATGMAAVTASMLSQLNAGDHVVSSSVLFGSCRYIVETLLPRFGISHTFVDGRDLNQWREAVRPNTKVFFCETPANPTLEMVDIAGVAAISRECGARFIVDNVFATPILQKPLQFGADICVYSATKHIDGQGRCLGGAVVATHAFIEEYLKDFLRQTGPSLSPFNAWVLLKGVETLPLRVERQSASAAQIANYLGERRGVSKVLYPGRDDFPQRALAKAQMTSGGPMVAFHVEGGKAATFRLVNALRIIKISNNLGDAKSLISHPATTTHQRLSPDARATLGIDDDLLRLSVGLEDPQDLIEDLDEGLRAAGL